MYGKTPAAPNEQLNQDIQLLCGEYARYNGFDEEPVSYTHLTLPTKA